MAKPGYKSQRRSTSSTQVRRNENRANHAGKKHAGKNSSAPPPAERTDQRKQAEPIVLPPRKHWSGPRLKDQAGVILTTPSSDDYELIDSGEGRKLERYGDKYVERPEGQAIWRRSASAEEWAKADAIFTGDRDEEGAGRWLFPKGDFGETWPLQFDGMSFHGRFTSFRHVGVFPEQAAHWHGLQNAIRNANRPIKMLNLFGYTGVASLVGARAGAEVTHVDASKKAIGWGRENQELAGLQEKPIRWICDDAVKFCAREVRREQSYDVILLDPPAYGRGPKGEVWQLFDHLPHMLDLVRELQSQNPLMTVLTSYAIRASSFALHEIMQEVMAGLDGELESGELVLSQTFGQRSLSTSMFTRFFGKDCAR